VSLGTELDGTIVMPAARAGVYAVKLTPESVDNDGFQPGASCWDSQGPYAKTATDIATLSAILQLHDPGYYQPLTTSWNGLKVGFADPSLWRSYPTAIEPVEGFFNQTDNALFAAQAKIEESGGKVAQSVPVASWKDITSAMPDFSQMEDIFCMFFASSDAHSC
jgi:amidase